MDLLTPLSPDDRVHLLRDAEAACAAKEHFGGSHSMFWLRQLCTCKTRQEEIAFHNRRHREFEKLIGEKTYKDPVAAVDAQGSRLRKELEAFRADADRVVTLTPGEWGLAWKPIAPRTEPQGGAPWELLARATGRIYYVIPSAEYFPVLNQLLVMKLAPRAEPRLADGAESPLLEPNDALVAVGTEANNAAIAELAIRGGQVQAVALRDACGALVVPCPDARGGLALLRRAIRGDLTV
ncbi:MAG: hypothetical protein FJW32_11625 [Acidobacteria bacterium]|nr:hypothetical protein [Acidobacteriota bacterium]